GLCVRKCQRLGYCGGRSHSSRGGRTADNPRRTRNTVQSRGYVAWAPYCRPGANSCRSQRRGAARKRERLNTKLSTVLSQKPAPLLRTALASGHATIERIKARWRIEEKPSCYKSKAAAGVGPLGG